MKHIMRHYEERNYDYARLIDTNHTPNWISQEMAVAIQQDWDDLIEYEEENEIP